jgi:hypothetical protein
LLNRDQLRDLLSQPGLTQKDKLLLCLALDASIPKATKEIKEIASNVGLRTVQNWNISTTLARSQGLAIRGDSGWELTSHGEEHVRELAAGVIATPASQVSISLRGHLSKIKNPQTAAFVEEAVQCFEARLYRAAVVLSWVGGVSLLYDYVIQNCLAPFNAEAKRRNSRWKDAKTRDDLARMREKDFLQILQSLSVVGKNVREELENCLRLRNACGHPSSLKISENRVAAHIEMLILNVFSRF